MNCTPKVRRKTFGVQFTGAASFFARKLGDSSRFSKLLNNLSTNGITNKNFVTLHIIRLRI